MLETEYPSATRVISDMGLSPDFDAIPGNAVAYASERGKRIHGVVACELIGQSYAAHEDARDAGNEDKAVAFEMVEWMHKYGYTEIVAVEQRIYHATRRFNGQPDWVMRNPTTRKIAVIDTKTGGVKSASHRVQVGGAYVELVLDASLPGVTRETARVNVEAVIVYINDKRIEVVRMTPLEIMTAWMRFQEALNLWWFRHEAGTLPKAKARR